MRQKLKIGLYALGIFALLFLCAMLFPKSIAILDPKGWIAWKERDLLVTATALMLIVVIPVFLLTFFVVWRYRAGNSKATYKPDWDHNTWLECVWWGIPLVIISILAVMTWQTSHSLDPYKPIESNKKPLTVQVVALQWRWLFIYPEQKVATVNFLKIPEKTPIQFEITADAPMNSFWIPQLSGQIFAMPGMKTKLYVIADGIGKYDGFSANLSGEGFAKMRFTVESLAAEEFEKWLKEVKASTNQLAIAEYRELAQPSLDRACLSYAYVKKGLYDWIVMKYMMPCERETTNERKE